MTDISDPSNATIENLDGARANAIYEGLKKSCRERHDDEARRSDGYISMRQACVCGHPDLCVGPIGRLCRHLRELGEQQASYQAWIDKAVKLKALLGLTAVPTSSP